MDDPDKLIREKMKEARQMDYLTKSLDPKASLLEKNVSALKGMFPDAPRVTAAPEKRDVARAAVTTITGDRKSMLMEKAVDKALSLLAGRAVSGAGAPLTLATETYNALKNLSDAVDPEYAARYMADQYGPLPQLPKSLRRELDDAAMERLRRDGYLTDQPHSPKRLQELTAASRKVVPPAINLRGQGMI